MAIKGRKVWICGSDKGGPSVGSGQGPATSFGIQMVTDDSSFARKWVANDPENRWMQWFRIV